jgi:hypothetical protein
MSTALLQRTSSTADISASVSLWVAASDYHSKAHVILNTTAAVAEAESLAEEAYIRVYHAVVPKRSMEEEEAEEREWDGIVNKPHVRQALRRMAIEARQQYYAGETEEGGFGLA